MSSTTETANPGEETAFEGLIFGEETAKIFNGLYSRIRNLSEYLYNTKWKNSRLTERLEEVSTDLEKFCTPAYLEHNEAVYDFDDILQHANCLALLCRSLEDNRCGDAWTKQADDLSCDVFEGLQERFATCSAGSANDKVYQSTVSAHLEPVFRKHKIDFTKILDDRERRLLEWQHTRMEQQQEQHIRSQPRAMITEGQHGDQELAVTGEAEKNNDNDDQLVITQHSRAGSLVQAQSQSGIERIDLVSVQRRSFTLPTRLVVPTPTPHDTQAGLEFGQQTPTPGTAVSQASYTSRRRPGSVYSHHPADQLQSKNEDGVEPSAYQLTIPDGSGQVQVQAQAQASSSAVQSQPQPLTSVNTVLVGGEIFEVKHDVYAHSQLVITTMVSGMPECRQSYQNQRALGWNVQDLRLSSDRSALYGVAPTSTVGGGRGQGFVESGSSSRLIEFSPQHQNVHHIQHQQQCDLESASIGYPDDDDSSDSQNDQQDQEAVRKKQLDIYIGHLYHLDHADDDYVSACVKRRVRQARRSARAARQQGRRTTRALDVGESVGDTDVDGDAEANVIEAEWGNEKDSDTSSIMSWLNTVKSGSEEDVVEGGDWRGEQAEFTQ